MSEGGDGGKQKNAATIATSPQPIALTVIATTCLIGQCACAKPGIATTCVTGQCACVGPPLTPLDVVACHCVCASTTRAVNFV